MTFDNKINELFLIKNTVSNKIKEKFLLKIAIANKIKGFLGKDWPPLLKFLEQKWAISVGDKIKDFFCQKNPLAIRSRT